VLASARLHLDCSHAMLVVFVASMPLVVEHGNERMSHYRFVGLVESQSPPPPNTCECEQHYSSHNCPPPLSSILHALSSRAAYPSDCVGRSFCESMQQNRM
jgi:hypothetical protein